jgi:hypothetical protein
VEDLNSSQGHVTKTLIPRFKTKILELASSVNARFKALSSPSNLAAPECGPPAPNHADDANGSMDNADYSRGLAPARKQAPPPPVAPPPVDVLGNNNSNTEPHAHNRNAPNAPPDHVTSTGSTAPPTPPTAAGTNVSPNGTYTLPTGHFGLRLTTLQLHVNSYREQYNDGYLPPHLHLQGLAESIHQNAQARLQDTITPCLRRTDVSSCLVQGILIVNCVGREDSSRGGFQDCGGRGYFPRIDQDWTRNVRDRTTPHNSGNGGYPRGLGARQCTPGGPGWLVVSLLTSQSP